MDQEQRDKELAYDSLIKLSKSRSYIMKVVLQIDERIELGSACSEDMHTLRHRQKALLQIISMLHDVEDS